jgi:hypothetical protein
LEFWFLKRTFLGFSQSETKIACSTNVFCWTKMKPRFLLEELTSIIPFQSINQSINQKTSFLKSIGTKGLKSIEMWKVYRRTD